MIFCKIKKHIFVKQMKKYIFNIGDNISVIDDTIKGVIIAIKDKIIQLEDEDGFVYSYNFNEVVVIDNDLYSNIKSIPKNRKITSVKRKIVKAKKQTVLEVDLHIHQITHSNKYLSNSAMVTRQIAHAKAKLDYAIKHHIQKVVFIHGKGKGVLRTELLHLLKNYKVEINDASYKKYGKGAMEVYF